MLINCLEDKMENESHLAGQETLAHAVDLVCEQTAQISKELNEMQHVLIEMKDASFKVFADLEGLVLAQADFVQSIKPLLTYSQAQDLLAAFRLLIDKQTTVTKSFKVVMQLFQAQDALSATLTKSDTHLVAIHKLMAIMQTLPLANVSLSAGAQLQNQQ